MKIAYINVNNPYDRSLRSGIPYSIFHELKKEFDVEWVKTEIIGIYCILYQFVRIYERIVRVCGYTPLHNPLRAWLKGKSLSAKIKGSQYDAIFSTDSEDIAFLKVDCPIFYRTDALVHSMIDYYYFKVPLFAQKWARSVEEHALQNTTMLFSPSQWIIDAIKEQHLLPDLSKVVLIETGANIDNDYAKPKNHHYSVDKRMNMILVGYDLKRKGVDVAYETLCVLNNQYGMKCILTIIGGIPEEKIKNDENVRCIGKLDKNVEEEYHKFYQEFSDADIFLFPTKAECHGIVNCEAAAYALPIYSYHTGGVPSYCIDGVNGRTLPLTANGTDFANLIYHDVVSEKMNELSVNSRVLYETKFNWTVWGDKVRLIIKEKVMSER